MAAAPNNTDSDDDDSDVAFATMDFAGVNFDEATVDDVAVLLGGDVLDDTGVTDIISPCLQLEHGLLFHDYSSSMLDERISDDPKTLEWARMIQNGKYISLLRASGLSKPSIGGDDSMATVLDEWVTTTYLHNTETENTLLQVELIGMAALNIFLQVNYTGPSLDQVAQQSHEVVADDDDFYDIIEPYTRSNSDGNKEESKVKTDTALQQKNDFHNQVLSELSVDGDWPCQVCQLPYWLLVARILLLRVANFTTNGVWWFKNNKTTTKATTQQLLLPAARVWSLRAAVAHSRLFLVDEPSTTLWNEISSGFKTVLTHYCAFDETNTDSKILHKQQQEAASLVLEWGLAQHFMDRADNGRLMFHKAIHYSGLQVEVTGAVGKRTKFQQDAIAQFQVKATSRWSGEEATTNENDLTNSSTKPAVDTSSIAIRHSEDEILFEKVRYEDEADNNVSQISVLDQTILMALCLDVKNNNPDNDGLTAEEMGAYLSRVLDQSNDWMVYATALLERAWLEFSNNHGRERAILQLQALTDQHTNRLTLTQSTFTAVQEQSAQPQERLLHIHKIVYPPRWSMLRDLAERYANMGIVTSAAELFTDIELWDSVVECYKRAGKEKLAKEICRERLAQGETPRMWAALGDLTNDVECYHKAIELSNGRFSQAYISLGKHEFDRGNLEEAGKHYRKALALRPLVPHVWFRLGTISMQLKDWGSALEAFSTVVQQSPEEADAWANVAAVHMHNRNPSEAYPALKESLKYSRNNWRVWTSQLYTCIDLEKYDEAVQACNVLLDLQEAQSKVPNLEEKCVKAIVGKTLERDRKVDATRRTLTRVHTLLDRLAASPAFVGEAWIYEILAYFSQQVGFDEDVLENLLKEHRALQAVDSWERDLHQIDKVVIVVSQIGRFYLSNGSKESLVKCRYLVKGVIQKIKKVYDFLNESKMPTEQLEKLESLLEQVVEATKKLTEETAA